MPKIETDRLILREMVPDDLSRLAAIWADPGVTRMIGVPPRSRAENWDALLRNAGNWHLFGHGQWAVTWRDTGEMIGQTGCFYARRGHGAAFDSVPEAGWVLASEAHGQGIGHEAVTAALAWFDREIGGPTVAQIDIRNVASRALAARLGFVAYDEVGSADDRLVLLRREGRPMA